MLLKMRKILTKEAAAFCLVLAGECQCHLNGTREQLRDHSLLCAIPEKLEGRYCFNSLCDHVSLPNPTASKL